jgi:hypothetical protein
MREEEEQQKVIGLRRIEESDGKSMADAPKQPLRKHSGSTEARKNRRTKKTEMDERNRLVTAAAIEFKARHNRLPTVGEIAAETKYSRRKIYATAAYKKGKIARNSSNATSEMIGGGGSEIEHRDGESTADPTAGSEPASKQTRPEKPAQADLESCYLCNETIPAGRRPSYKCPRCGNRACSSCLELMSSFSDLCVSCERKARRRKAIWDTIALLVIVIILIITLYFILMSLFARFGPIHFDHRGS